MKSELRNPIALLGEYLRRRKPSHEEEQSVIGRVWKDLRPETNRTPQDAVRDFQSTRPQTAFVTRPRVWAAAAIVLAVGLSVVFVRNTPKNGSPAILEAVGGPRNIEFGELVRADAGGSSVISLVDGSRIEMRSDSELALEAAADGVRVRLNGGTVIVSAARQHTGHLYVQTKDVTVSVVGTVFLVNSEVKGSRVAVIQGEVQVQQGSTSKKLRSGEQVTTNPIMQSVPVIEEILWSRNASNHLALLQQSIALVPQIAPKPLEFEAASIKPEPPTGPINPNEPGYGGGGVECRGVDGFIEASVRLGTPLGRCMGRHVSLMWLIAAAYDLDNSAPGRIVQRGYSASSDQQQFEPWISNLWKNGFQIDAKAENPATTTKEELREMLKSFLAERFKLRVTRETREIEGLVLTVGKNGPKLMEASSETSVTFSQRVIAGIRQITAAGNGGMKAFINALQPFSITDRTDLKGIYAFNFSYTVPIPPPASETGDGGGRRGAGGPGNSPTLSALQDALQDQLGLRLENGKAPADFIVIEHVEKPTEN